MVVVSPGDALFTKELPPNAISLDPVAFGALSKQPPSTAAVHSSDYDCKEAHEHQPEIGTWSKVPDMLAEEAGS